MAKASTSPCTKQSCNTLVKGGGRCDKHPYPAWQKRPDRNHSNLYNDRRWRKERENYLINNPLCAQCEKKGRTALAQELDHIIPHKGDLVLFWAESNWQGLCTPCHKEKTANDRKPV